jgi:class 3 adenylate cyclase
LAYSNAIINLKFIKNMNINDSQMPESLKGIFAEQIEIYNKGRSITVRNQIPDTTLIPITDQTLWFKIPDVICVYVDMIGSTKLSAVKQDIGTAGAYQLFTNTAVMMFHEMDAPYIDVRGDGVFALFNSNQIYRAFVSAISFKTFAHLEFVARLQQLTTAQIGCHIGIDQKTVLVRKVGLKRKNGRSDRQNEVWAGKPVNMAAKLASIGSHNQLFISDRYYEKLYDEMARYSCGCPNGYKKLLWQEVDVTDKKLFDFEKAYYLESNWCETHGKEYFEALLNLDN